MDDDVILLSDDEDLSVAAAAKFIKLGRSPQRPIRMRLNSPEILPLHASISPPHKHSTGAVSAVQPLRVSSLAKSASEGTEGTTKKTRIEAEQENQRKQADRDQKKQARDLKKANDANEKKRKAIEREISTSKKTKAEEFLFCRVGREAIEIIPGLDATLRVLMEDRKILTQLEIKSDLETRVEWWRKCVEAMELDADRGVERIESMIQEPIEVIIIKSAELATKIKASTLEQHVIELRYSLGVSNALLILLVYGKLNVKDSERDAQGVVLHEKLKTQIREVHSPDEAALFLCQLHRATARLHMERSERIIVDVTKGQRERVGLVSDWWTKMLAMIPGFSESVARVLAATFPNPLELMARIETEGAEAVEAILVEARTDIGMRIGPKRARKVIEMLTTNDGMELFT